MPRRRGRLLCCVLQYPIQSVLIFLFRDLDRARAQTMRRDRAASEWDLERIDGGLSDVELIISTLIYRHAAAHPSIQSGNIEDALDVLARAGMIPADVAATLTAARAFWRRLATAKALASWKDPQQQPVRPRFAALLARAAEVDRYAQVKTADARLCGRGKPPLRATRSGPACIQPRRKCVKTPEYRPHITRKQLFPAKP